MADTKWWLTALTVGGDVLAAILGAALGSKWAEGADWRTRTKEIVAAAQKRLELDREDLMKELLRLDTEGAAIVNLLARANAQGGIITIQLGQRIRRYLEHWIVKMLLQIEPKDRQQVLADLNDVLEDDPSRFFAYLGIMDNDGWLQYPRLAKLLIAEDLPAIKSDLQAFDQKTAGVVNQFNRWLDSKGVR